LTRARSKSSHPNVAIFLSGIFFFCLGQGFAFALNLTSDLSLNVRSNIISSELKSVAVIKASAVYDRVVVSGLTNVGAPQEPLLPVRTVKFLVPAGQKLKDITVGWAKRRHVRGSYFIEPASYPVRLSNTASVSPVEPSAEIYNSNAAYPGKLYEIVTEQDMCGYKIVFVNLYPVEYFPASRQLYYYENLNLNVELESISQVSASSATRIRSSAIDQKRVLNFVDNPDVLTTYSSSAPTLDAPLAITDYLVITNDDLYNNSTGTFKISDLITHKQTTWSLTTAVETIEDIRLNYAGDDDQEKIRECIKDYYASNGTVYVLLIGDGDGSDTPGFPNGETEGAPIIPHRGLYGRVVADDGTYTDNSIPADMYYSNLATELGYEDFDRDGDGIYGEANDGVGGGEVDMIAEVYIGRAAVDSYTELSNFIKKLIDYETTLPTDTYLKEAVFAGEDMLDGITYGSTYMEEIRTGSSNNGYTTAGLAGSGFFNMTTLYDNAFISWPKADLINKLNSGTHILNHLGHADVNLFGKTISGVDADALTNSGEYFFGYTQGCYSGAFDNRTTATSSPLYSTIDCVVEHFVAATNGAFAFIANTRYGWYNPGGTNGASQRYQREFWDAVMNEGKVNLGKALADAKEDNIGAAGNAAVRWCMFETTLLGDPHTPLLASFLSPTDFSASSISFSGNSWIALRWKNSTRSELQSVMIRYRTDGNYPSSETDGTLLLERPATAAAYDSFNHMDISAGNTYHYTVFGYDGTNYEGGNATFNKAFAEAFGSGSSTANTGKSDCFIATVCYGGNDVYKIKILRNLRDSYLRKTHDGRTFIGFYYAIGPYIADVLRESETLKEIARKIIDPFVYLTGRCTEGEFDALKN